MAQGRLHLGNRPAPVHPGFYYFTILLLFYHDPRRLHLGNRPAPVHPGFYYFAMLLFYYFSTVLFYYVLFYC